MVQVSLQLEDALRRALRNPSAVSQESIARLLGDGEVGPPSFGDKRRSSGRMGVRLQGAIRPQYPGGRRRHAVITDVGLSGFSVDLDESMPGAGPVTVEFCLPPPGPCCLLNGRVRWIREDVLPARLGVVLDDESSWTWFAALRRIAEASTRTPNAAPIQA